MTYYLTDGGHVLISGATGSRPDYGGKTVIGNWWATMAVEGGHFDAAVYINAKGYSWVRGETVEGLQELAEAWDRGARHFDYRLTYGQEETEHQQLVRLLEELPGRKLVVHDEAQRYVGAPSLGRCLAELGNLETGSIKSLVITQRPWNLREDLLSNMPVKIWVGPMTGEGVRFFKTWEMAGALEEARADPRFGEPFTWIVTDASELQAVNPPVPAEFAP